MLLWLLRLSDLKCFCTCSLLVPMLLEILARRLHYHGIPDLSASSGFTADQACEAMRKSWQG